jgi:hypothetical protein
VKSHAYVRRKLPLASVLARFLLVAFWVFATFNPSLYSLSTWLLSDYSLSSVKIFVAFSLALCWLIVLRIALAGLGGLGLAYVGLAFLSFALLEAQFGLLRFFSTYALVLIGELVIALILTFGLVLSYWIRQAAGQSAVVKRPP